MSKQLPYLLTAAGFLAAIPWAAEPHWPTRSISEYGIYAHPSEQGSLAQGREAAFRDLERGVRRYYFEGDVSQLGQRMMSARLAAFNVKAEFPGCVIRSYHLAYNDVVRRRLDLPDHATEETVRVRGEEFPI